MPVQYQSMTIMAWRETWAEVLKLTIMSVIIKDMDMPKCCNDCFALNEDGDYPVCIITQEQRGYNFKKWEKRMDRCPLAEKDEN